MLKCGLSEFSTLSIQSDLAREVHFTKVIEIFASQKVDKAFLK